MYDIIRSVIVSKNYELSGILKKIDTIWLQGGISDEQKKVLMELARENANPMNEINLVAKVEELDRRMKALEEAKSNETEDSENETEESVSYPGFVVGKWYYNGDKISYKGKNYECIAPEGQVCTWNPDEYPAYWEEVIEE